MTFAGGSERIRTAVGAFAELSLATRPRNLLFSIPLQSSSHLGCDTRPQKFNLNYKTIKIASDYNLLKKRRWLFEQPPSISTNHRGLFARLFRSTHLLLQRTQCFDITQSRFLCFLVNLINALAFRSGLLLGGRLLGLFNFG